MGLSCNIIPSLDHLCWVGVGFGFHSFWVWGWVVETYCFCCSGGMTSSPGMTLTRLRFGICACFLPGIGLLLVCLGFSHMDTSCLSLVLERLCSYFRLAVSSSLAGVPGFCGAVAVTALPSASLPFAAACSLEFFLSKRLQI